MEFAEPRDGRFTSVLWNVDLRRIGPVVRPSREREAARRSLVHLAEDLRTEGGVRTAHVLEVTFLAPISAAPRYDLALLVHGDRARSDEIVERTTALGLPAPEVVLTGRNSGRLGDTEAREGSVLLNHFAGSATPSEAVEAWKAVAPWYAQRLGVDNSTLVEADAGAPFLIMNYAVIPGAVLPFLAGQLLRPSFYRVVRRRLAASGIAAYPSFVRRVTA